MLASSSLLSIQAGGTTFRDCSATSSPLACKLDSVLTLLYIVAIVLAVILVVVILLAIRYYRKNRGDHRDIHH